MEKQPTSSSPSREDGETERLFHRILDERKAKADADLNVRPVQSDIRREKKRLKQPVTRVDLDNIFTSHLSQHRIAEAETEPELIKNRIWQKQVGVRERAVG